jgi:Fur family ferric uptake transcriptional regulator
MQEEAKFEQFLRSAGLKMTRTRREVLKEVFRHHDHFDAEELYLKLKEHDANVSRATVYRTLTLLVSSGLVRKMEIGEGRSIFEHILGHTHHDHLICLQCNKILEFHNPKIEELQNQIARKYKFKLLSHTQQLYGICKECQADEKE